MTNLDIITEPSAARQMLTTGRAARYTGVAESTLEKLRLTGRGPTYIKLGRSVRYSPDDLDEWMSSHRRKSTSVAVAA